MKKPLVLLFLLTSLYVQAQRIGYGQKYLEVGFLFGVTNYSGDLTEKAVDLRHTNVGYGAFMRYHFTRNLGLKAHVYSGALSGDDAGTTRFDRKFRFSTSLVELGLVGEWYLFAHDRFTGTGIHQFTVTPYLYAGIGYTYAKASAEYYGPPDKMNTYLKVLFPEDGLKHNFILAPVGGGLRFDVFDYLVISVETGFRPVFSDDIDGIRRNGNPKNGDWYYFSGITASFILGQAKK
jgi:hypothetical protein